MTMHKDTAQDVFKVRRDYNNWVANETLEDYALRYTPLNFRKWSIGHVASTAFSTSSFMVLEALGATLLLHFGFINSLFAILASGGLILLVSFPIGYYAAEYNLDMDLLTRGAGFGYLGSTITSLIYATFTFVFFSFEAAIMAYSISGLFGLKLHWSYLFCSLVVIPIVTQGITVISQFQKYTQAIWLVLLFLPYVYLFVNKSYILHDITVFPGVYGSGHGFDFGMFCAGVSILMPLLAQIGEQADYLRFMPDKTEANKRAWHLGVMVGGSGWVVMSFIKILGGLVLAYLALHMGLTISDAVNPNQLYLLAYHQVFVSPWVVLSLVTVLIVISQLKINVTNAYAGSLAWSNFFSRLTHNHPGRVVWVVFNILIALMLMELNLLQVMDRVLGLFSNIVVPWVMTVVVDLVINKPLGLSPKGIEFRRAYLYDINPVGLISVSFTFLISVVVYLGLMGNAFIPYAILISIFFPVILTPLIAYLTHGKYYIAREPVVDLPGQHSYLCCVCGNNFEKPDIVSSCPAYQGNICSLCCTLELRCQDQCRPHARLGEQFMRWASGVLPSQIITYLKFGLGHYLILMAGFTVMILLLFGLVYFQGIQDVGRIDIELIGRINIIYVRVFFGLFLFAGVTAWWLVLASKSRQIALEEAKSQTQMLMQEIEAHNQTEQLLQEAKRSADMANMAKSRYIMSISHELRTPLNSILGYAQILDGDESIPANRRKAVSIMRRSGEHLLSVIEGTLDIARIESSRLRLDMKPFKFREMVQEIVCMFDLQSCSKGIDFIYCGVSVMPIMVRSDASRVRQVLINVIGNAIKFTTEGKVVLNLKYLNEVATFDIIDTGPGIDAKDIERIFEPFTRVGHTDRDSVTGTGLGLTISKMLVNLMGGDISVSSTVGVGSSFKLRLYLPQVRTYDSVGFLDNKVYIGYQGERKKILIVDNEVLDRDLLVSILSPLGFELAQAATGYECLELMQRFKPDLIFVDLAMPEMDGWQTIRLIRSQRLTSCEIAVISANVFEKTVGNDLGVSSRQFHTKPLNIGELLNYIGEALQLDWISHQVNHIEALPNNGIITFPPDEYLMELNKNIDMGFLNGILSLLDQINQLDESYFDFVNVARNLTANFKLVELKMLIRRDKLS